MRIFLSVIILLISSSSLVDGDLFKFLFSGQSSTYGVFLIRHNYLVVYGLALIVIFSLFYLRKNKLNKYLLGISLILWLLSLRTFAVVKNYDTTLVSGISIIPICKCEVVKEDSCDMIFDFFLEDKIKKAISD